jgi:hypothetical protein
MAKVYRINVETGKGIDETTRAIAGQASAVLNELFPGADWKLAMTLLAKTVTEMRDEEPPDPRLLDSAEARGDLH